MPPPRGRRVKLKKKCVRSTAKNGVNKCCYVKIKTRKSFQRRRQRDIPYLLIGTQNRVPITTCVSRCRQEHIRRKKPPPSGSRLGCLPLERRSTIPPQWRHLSSSQPPFTARARCRRPEGYSREYLLSVGRALVDLTIIQPSMMLRWSRSKQARSLSLGETSYGKHSVIFLCLAVLVLILFPTPPPIFPELLGSFSSAELVTTQLPEIEGLTMRWGADTEGHDHDIFQFHPVILPRSWASCARMTKYIPLLQYVQGSVARLKLSSPTSRNPGHRQKYTGCSTSRSAEESIEHESPLK